MHLQVLERLEQLLLALCRFLFRLLLRYDRWWWRRQWRALENLKYLRVAHVRCDHGMTCLCSREPYS